MRLAYPRWPGRDRFHAPGSSTGAVSSSPAVTLILKRRPSSVRTYSPKSGDVQRQWFVIDANDVVLGRLATQAATLLRGKHKPIFPPHVHPPPPGAKKSRSSRHTSTPATS